jgi:hypothetical protein
MGRSLFPSRQAWPYQETNAGRAEENEVIQIEAPEDHPLQGKIELCFWRDGTLTFEFECAGTGAPTVRPHRLNFDTEAFEVELEPGE